MNFAQTIWSSDEDNLTLLQSQVNPILGKFFQKCIPGINTSLLTYLLNFQGLEIEGNEVSLGVILDLNNNHRSAKVSAFISPSILDSAIKDNIHFDLSTALESYRGVMRYMREKVLGWVPGDIHQPLLYLDKAFKIVGVEILDADLNANLSYKRKINNRDLVFGFWVKPTRSLRIYDKTGWIGQIMELRDTGGYAARNLNHIISFSNAVFKNCWKMENDFPFMKLLIEACIHLSELRRGCAIYIMDHDTWNKVRAQKRPVHIPDTIGTPSKTRKIWDNPVELLCYLDQDGATVISPSGDVISFGAYLNSGGGRKNTAKEITRDNQKCLALIVSQDGPFYIYSYGIVNEQGESNDALELETSEGLIKEGYYKRLDFNLQPKTKTRTT